jgi:hypothetical protein
MPDEGMRDGGRFVIYMRVMEGGEKELPRENLELGNGKS